MKIKSLLTLVAVLFALNPLSALASVKPLALVWNGPGACKPGCGSAAAHVARLAGFRTQYIYPGLTDFSVFNEAKLWVQPGGKSTTAAESMGPALLNQIREFVGNGGGYVGFCAGAFLSTQLIGTSGATGYGISPGETEVYIDSNKDHRMLKMKTTTAGERYMLYAGGPYFHITDDQLKAVQGEVTAWYPDGKVAGIHAHYGKGKVAVIGTHPEAGWVWKLLDGKIDPDGSDIFFAVEMVKYATQP
jgi:hypothetical protein